jgi:DNA-binding response OmpR family regulator
VKEEINSQKKKILIAEDEKPLARALTLKLEHAGFSVKSVSEGDSALGELKKEQYDLLLLDLVMPKRDGFSVLEEIKKTGIKIEIAVLTNLIQEEDKKKVQDLGVNIFMEKANTPIADVVKKVSEILKV